MYGDPSYCNKCGRPISFIQTKRGKMMPVDGFSLQIIPDKEGPLYINESGEMIRGRVVGMEGPATVKVWQSHFATCPVLNKDRPRKTETWREKQSRLAHERLEKEIAEAEAKAARREEKQKKEATRRAFEEQQLSFFGM